MKNKFFFTFLNFSLFGLKLIALWLWEYAFISVCGLREPSLALDPCLLRRAATKE